LIDRRTNEKFWNKIPGWKKSKIFVAGAGISGLIDILTDTDTALFINDLSPKAIDIAKARCTARKQSIQWICQDVSKNLSLEPGSIDLWIDRAVLHFLVDESKIQGYFKS